MKNIWWQINLDQYDYYRIGLINFHQGKYAQTLYNFRLAHCNLSKKSNLCKSSDFQANVSKWFAFTGIVILLWNGENLEFLET